MDQCREWLILNLLDNWPKHFRWSFDWSPVDWPELRVTLWPGKYIGVTAKRTVSAHWWDPTRVCSISPVQTVDTLALDYTAHNTRITNEMALMRLRHFYSRQYPLLSFKVHEGRSSDVLLPVTELSPAGDQLLVPHPQHLGHHLKQEDQWKMVINKEKLFVLFLENFGRTWKNKFDLQSTELVSQFLITKGKPNNHDCLQSVRFSKRKS